jgi:hypothetical protein
MIAHLIDVMFTYFPSWSRLFSIPFGVFDDCSSFSAIFAIESHSRLFVTAQDISSIDPRFIRGLNHRLDEWFKNQAEIERRQFVSMVYDVCCPPRAGI